MDPPESIPNSEVKRCNADGSVGFPHVRVGHRQVVILIPKLIGFGIFYIYDIESSPEPKVRGILLFWHIAMCES